MTAGPVPKNHHAKPCVWCAKGSLYCVGLPGQSCKECWNGHVQCKFSTTPPSKFCHFASFASDTDLIFLEGKKAKAAMATVTAPTARTSWSARRKATSDHMTMV